jgi:hypothetical protein
MIRRDNLKAGTYQLTQSGHGGNVHYPNRIRGADGHMTAAWGLCRHFTDRSHLGGRRAFVLSANR